MKSAMKELSARHVHPDPPGQDAGGDGGAASGPSKEEFVNTGLKRWEEIRHQWLSSASQSSSSSSASSSASSIPSSSRKPKKKTKRHARDIDIDEVIDLIVSNRWRQQAPKNLGSSSTSSLDTAKSATRRRDEACFPQPVALPQMVDVLVDLWEAEGLDI
ncbi:hypothetical protein ACHAXT_008254 [Thalassiosira profunda]